MKKRYWIIFGIAVIFVAVGYWRYCQYPLPNPTAQQQRSQCVTFFTSKPSLIRTKAFLKSHKIEYSQLSHSDIFAGNANTEYQRQHQKTIDSEITFRILDIEKPFCGRTDAMFILSFNKSGELLKAEDMDWRCCCLDF